MTSRYKTEAEKAGLKRRMAALRERKKLAGLRQFVFWLTEDEIEKVKAFVEELRKESNT